MRRNPSQLALGAVSLLCILILAACNCAPILRYITISPSTATISVGTTQQFTATAYYSDGTSQPATNLVTWGSSNTTIATITAGGIATPLAPGTTTITAAAAGTPGASATLNVSQLTAITLTPANATIPAGTQQQYDAVGTYTLPGGTPGTSDVTTLVSSVNGWSSSNTEAATIGAGTGLATAAATGTGTTVISATLDGVTGNTNLTVGTAAPLSLQITPASPTMAVGNALTFTAVELLSNGNTQPLTGTVTWTSGTPATATILANSGLSAAFAAGTTTITATETTPSEGTLTGTATLTVVTGKSHYAYISNVNQTDLQWYAVNAATSPYLSGGGDVGPIGYDPVQTVIHPTGNYMYEISSVGDVYLYDIAPSTSITPAPGTPTLTNPTPQVAGAGNSDYGVIDPYGRFLYVSDAGSGGSLGTIHGFQISQTDGSLTAIQGSPFTTNLNGPVSLVIDQSGTYLYAVNSGNNTISSYTIDQTATATGGALTPLAGKPTIATGGTPQYAALHPSGTYLYVANQGTVAGTGTVSAYSIDTTSTDPTVGQLTALSGSPYTITGATDVYNVLVDPSGNYLYVLDAGPSVGTGLVYSYNLSSGVVGTEIGSPAATGAVPFSFAINPAGSLLMAGNSFDNPGTLSLFPDSAGTLGTGITVPSDTASSQSSFGSDPIFVVFYNAP